MSFIETVPADRAAPDVLEMYERQCAHWGYVPNYAKVFCHRPEVMRLWAQLQAGIKRNMDKRRFELITFVAAVGLRSTLCSLAHGRALTAFLSPQDVQKLAAGEVPASITPAEAAMVEFARRVARDASSIEQGDVDHLKQLGFSDAEVFDIVAVAAARAFWTKVIEGLGVAADEPFHRLDAAFVDGLTVGRPLQFERRA